jgi:hypothetical protein
MSAVKIIFKRSSLLGKRPTGANLEPGEIGLNTNSTDPGLFFEVNDGSVVKAGPTSYLPEALTQFPARGELWVDSDTKALSVGTDLNQWQKVAAPYLGGTNGLTVFVAPEFPNASDSLANDGQTVPFITINRAILEVTKSIIKNTLSGFSDGNNQYLIILAPGRHCVINRPGVSPGSFSVDFSNPYTPVTEADLAEFNPEGVGGLILPRGVSIIGLDLKKCEIRPTYVPKYTHPAFPEDYKQEINGPVYQNEPPSSVFRWSGNTYVSNFNAQDKIDTRLVTQTFSQEGTGWAVFRSERPHGLNLNDFVQFTYSDSTDQVGAAFKSGAYYVSPINNFEFLASVGPWASTFESPILATSLPASYFVPPFEADPKFEVSNIYPYYVPLDGESYELSSYSHHRLSVLKNATVDQLNRFYTKVQKAFSNVFGGQVNPALTSLPEYDIVAPTDGNYPSNLPSNSTDNSSPYQNTVNHRSDYGMANGDYDGNDVSGFKSVIVNASTAVILQKDPVAYEVYSTSSQDWIQLTQYTQQTLVGSPPITSIPTTEQLQILNNASIPNIRYYYTNLTTLDPTSGTPKSIGIPDPDNDFRHFGFRLKGANSYLQAQSTYTIGAALAVWAQGGAIISLTNATTNFGSVAMQAEGFAGINTLGGANEISKGFLLEGVVCPLQLLENSVTADQQKRILYLGSQVVQVEIDPADPAIQLVYMQRPFDPATILPYSLKPGSAVFISDETCTFGAFFATDGNPTCILSGDALQNPYSPGGAILRLRASDTTVPNGTPTTLDMPYIRRYIDPRTTSERSYGFYVRSTNPTSQAPQLGSVLRLNQTGQALSNTLKRNFQFDPGQYGGISQVFTVDFVETDQYSVSLNFNYKVSDSTQSTNYVVYSSLTDASSPWIQSYPVGDDYLPFNTPQGSYLTYQNKNYYAAENNLWNTLYYETNLNPLNGPTKVSPDKPDSPFVITSVLEKTEAVTESWQGYVPDPLYAYYEDIIDTHGAELSYMRGAVIPYTELGIQYQVDGDDGSPSLGIIYNTVAVDTDSSITTTPSTVIQTPEKMSGPWATNPTIGRPEIIEFSILSVKGLVIPEQGLSVLQLTNPTINALEYVRVISITSNVVQAIRNYYPTYAQGTLPVTWPIGTIAKTCVSSGVPEPEVYDPSWSITKSTMFRFFQLMGYTPGQIAPYLVPRYSGERLLSVSSIPLSPLNGYANLTSSWPIEFNSPSTILANTHTWQFAGYFDYSRGLPKYQVNQIPRKLSYDYASTTTWGGRLTVMGADENGQLIFLGPIREALTGQAFVNETPMISSANKQTYMTPPIPPYPRPILVYSTDDISGQFTGTRRTFDLTRGGYPVPGSQLSTNGVFVTLGGVVQKPGIAYTIRTNALGEYLPIIDFVEDIIPGTSCDIRVVTSEDDSQTLEVVSLTFADPFDGVQSNFVTSTYYPSLDNLNSFLFLSGVEQIPSGPAQINPAYTLSQVPGQSSVTFIGGAPLADTVLDFRAILSGAAYRSAGVSSLYTHPVDDFSYLFDGATVSFPLLIGGQPVDATLVNAENIFVSLAGVMQIPISQAGSPPAGNAYSVDLNPVSSQLEITFATPPTFGMTSSVRVITSKEFITCPLPSQLTDPTLKYGPGITINSENQVIAIDSGLVGP